jgi:outer membrane protein TolC
MLARLCLVTLVVGLTPLVGNALENVPMDPEVDLELSLPLSPGEEVTLKEALAAADARNLTLEAARAEVEVADGQLAKAWALALPVAGAGLTYVRADHADEVDFGKSLSEGLGPILEQLGIQMPPSDGETTVIRRQDTVTGNLQVALPLINVQNWYTISAARKGRGLASLSLEATRQQLLTGVAQAYYMALMSRSLVDLHAGQIKAAAHHLDFARKRLSTGAGLRIDVVRAETNLAEARQQLIAARLSLDTARDALGVLTGLGGLPMPVPGADLPDPRGGDEDLVRQAMVARPDLKLGEASVVLARRQWGAAWAGFLPTADMAWQGNYQFTEPSSLGSADRARWNLVFNVNIPIFQYFRIGELREKKAAIRAASLRSEDLRWNVAREVRQARRDYETAVATANLSDLQASLAGEAMGLALTAYESGAGSSLEVTEARRTVVAAEVGRVTQRLRTQIALLILHRATGANIPELVR